MNTQMADAFMAIFGYRRVENEEEDSEESGSESEEEK